MDRSTDRQGAFARARVVSLVLIALAVLGLAYLRFAGSDRISVPKGAHAGDLILDSCTYATENGGFEADCGTLVVPENRADPQSRLIALPVTRIHAKSDHPREPIFRLEAGPGITNMSSSSGTGARVVPEPDAGPRGLAPLRLRAHSGPMVVPADP